MSMEDRFIKKRCTKCGRVSTKDELKVEFDEGLFNEYCPNCNNDDLEDVVECAICGDVIPYEDMYGELGFPICESCMLDAAERPQNAIDFGADEHCTRMAEVNGFLYWMFENEIDDILLKELKSRYNSNRLFQEEIKKEAKAYCMDDSEQFGYWLESK